jgi:hypothetical protein
MPVGSLFARARIAHVGSLACWWVSIELLSLLTTLPRLAAWTTLPLAAWTTLPTLPPCHVHGMRWRPGGALERPRRKRLHDASRLTCLPARRAPPRPRGGARPGAAGRYAETPRPADHWRCSVVHGRSPNRDRRVAMTRRRSPLPFRVALPLELVALLSRWIARRPRDPGTPRGAQGGFASRRACGMPLRSKSHPAGSLVPPARRR